MKRDVYYTYAVTHDGEYADKTGNELSRHYSLDAAKAKANELAGKRAQIICVGRYTVTIDRNGMRLDEDEPGNANLSTSYPWRIFAKIGTYGSSSVEVKPGNIKVGDRIEYRHYLTPGAQWETALVEAIEIHDNHDFYFLARF